jgi:hypothetical protein
MYVLCMHVYTFLVPPIQVIVPCMCIPFLCRLFMSLCHACQLGYARIITLSLIYNFWLLGLTGGLILFYLSDSRSRLAFGGYGCWKSSCLPDILTQIFRGFTKSLQANTVIAIRWNRPHSVPPNSLLSPRFNVTHTSHLLYKPVSSTVRTLRLNNLWVNKLIH